MYESMRHDPARSIRSRVTPKKGMRKKPAASVPIILQIVPILPIRPMTLPPVSISCIRIFVTIGDRSPSKKLAGEKRIKASSIEENRISETA